MVQIKVASPTGLFLSTLPQIRRHGLLGQRCNRLVRAHPRLRGRAQVADGHRILARLLAADGQERQDLRQRVLPHLVVDLLVRRSVSTLRPRFFAFAAKVSSNSSVESSSSS